eukprot:TRINITY_DN7572_c0_g2_i6.p6 TRINITY_DN7572_c0_g2~~TRINITY_DN7572_c0_g2_i6.p6  ORF type:complete len:106 (+),score=3.37 TRINITY_DN7572_c0_g2_i6:376-693(+)
MRNRGRIIIRLPGCVYLRMRIYRFKSINYKYATPDVVFLRRNSNYYKQCGNLRGRDWFSRQYQEFVNSLSQNDEFILALFFYQQKDGINTSLTINYIYNVDLSYG